MKIAGSGSISQRYGSADPDPFQNFMDQQHCKKKYILGQKTKNETMEFL
jgi:hypothetical protein